MSGDSHLSHWWLNIKRRLGMQLLIMSTLTICFQALDHVEWFRAFDAAVLDALLRGHQTEAPKDIYIVEITDDDYQTFFDGKSPLNPATLLTLVRGVQEAGPKAIGVDIDTQSSEWQDPGLQDAKVFANKSTIWAGIPDNAEQAFSACSSLVMPAGGRVDAARIGLVAVPEDPDGVVRYRQARAGCVRPMNAKDKQLPDFLMLDPFYLAVCKRFRSLEQCVSDKEPTIIRFGRDRSSFRRINASTFLHCTDERGRDCTKTGEATREGLTPAHNAESAKRTITGAGLSDQQKQLLKNSLVLIGGSFSAARDVYPTPRGPMAGVELFASQLAFAGVPKSTLLGIFTDLFFAFAIFVFLQGLEDYPTASLTLAVVFFVFPFLAAGLFFEWGIAWIAPAGIMLGMVVSHFIDDYIGIRRRLTHQQQEIFSLRQSSSTTTTSTTELTVEEGSRE